MFASCLWEYRGAILRGVLRTGDGSDNDHNCVLVWLLGALALGLLLAPASRYGGSICPLFLLICGIFLWQGEWYRRTIPVIVTGAIVTLYMLYAAYSIGVLSRLAFYPQAETETALRTAVEHLPLTTSLVYVVNAPTVSTPAFIQALWRVPQEIVCLTQFFGCSRSAQPAPTSASADGGDVSVDSRLPPCAILYLNVKGNTLARGVTGTLSRGNLADYRFPRGRILGHGMRDPHITKVDIGSEVAIVLKPRHQRYVILYYD